MPNDKGDLGQVTDETRAAEARQAQVDPSPGRMPTEDEAQAADRFRDTADASVAAHEQEMTERGARVEGEGKIA